MSSGTTAGTITRGDPMCIISAEEEAAMHEYWLKVSKTSIFARHTRPGYQAVLYKMSIASSSRAAMILPLPVLPGGGDDGLSFIDLSAYPNFFDDLAIACRMEFVDLLEDFEDLDLATDEEIQMLTVHEVGDYQASYVPSMADFSRLDPRFRLADAVWDKMPDYSDYGFAVFQLKIALSEDEGETENDVHPMAFEFRTRNSDQLFFPTVHVHDGDYHHEAGFYHTFYCQEDHARAAFKFQRDTLMGQKPTPPEDFEEPVGDVMPVFDGYHWFLRSDVAASEFLEIDKCQGLVDPDKRVFAMTLFGDYLNVDMWLGETL